MLRLTNRGERLRGASPRPLPRLHPSAPGGGAPVAGVKVRAGSGAVRGAEGNAAGGGTPGAGWVPEVRAARLRPSWAWRNGGGAPGSRALWSGRGRAGGWTAENSRGCRGWAAEGSGWGESPRGRGLGAPAGSACGGSSAAGLHLRASERPPPPGVRSSGRVSGRYGRRRGLPGLRAKGTRLAPARPVGSARRRFLQRGTARGRGVGARDATHLRAAARRHQVSGRAAGALGLRKRPAPAGVWGCSRVGWTGEDTRRETGRVEARRRALSPRAESNQSSVSGQRPAALPGGAPPRPPPTPSSVTAQSGPRGSPAENSGYSA